MFISKIFYIQKLNFKQLTKSIEDPIKLKLEPAINNDQITFNEIVERVYGDLNVYVDLSSSSSEPHLDAVQVNLTITFSNGSIQNITQNSHQNYIWNLKYTPDSSAPIGTHHFNITVFDNTYYHYSNNFNFKIINNSPKITISLSNKTIYRNNTLYFNLTVSDVEDPSYMLSYWSAIYKTSNNQMISGTNDTKLERSYFFSDSFPNSELGSYYIKGVVTDKDGNSTTTIQYFEVINNIPIITSVLLEFSDSEYTDPSKNELLRHKGTLKISVNATDVEKALNPNLKLNIKTINSYNVTIDFGSIDPILTTPTYQFNYTLNVPKYRETGKYLLYLILYEQEFGMQYNSTAIYNFTVVNNPPNSSVVDFSINGKKSENQPLMFKEFEELKFSINVTDSDVEGIAYIKLCLIDQDSNWINLTFKNINNIINFTINPRVLSVGQWYAYIYIIDTDGIEVPAQNTMAFDIQKDMFSIYLPFIMILVGLIIGSIVTFLLVGTKYIRIKREIEKGTLVSTEKVKEIEETEITKSQRKLQQRIETISKKPSSNKKEDDNEIKPKKKFIRTLGEK